MNFIDGRIDMSNFVIAERHYGKLNITVGSFISICLITLAVVLPQIVHAAFGASGGAKWMPMYIPILIGGCLLGIKWGICIAVVSPTVSFLITAVFGEPMPAAFRLPYMIAELVVFACVSGLFSARIAADRRMIVPVVLLAALAGRMSFIAVAAIFDGISPLTLSDAWTQIQVGYSGLLLLFVTVPAAVTVLSALYGKYGR